MINIKDWINDHAGKTFNNFINGEWVPSTSGQTFKVYNPSVQEQVLGDFQLSEEEDVNKAVEAAHEAFKKWSKIPGPDRSVVLLRFAELLEEHSQELAFTLSAEQGKVLDESNGEVARAIKEIRFTAGEALRYEGSTMPSEKNNIHTTILRRPLGVIAAIAPWNFPVVTPIRKIIPALAYGCTVVYKPASETPWSSIRLMELLHEAGVPKGAVNLVTGGGSKVGNPLISHPLVKGISFTGSTPVGLGINEKASRLLKRTQLELGGKNPAIVLDYDDADYVAKQIVGAAFTCSGQRCTSISRVIVAEDKSEEITKAIQQELQQIKVGPASKSDSKIGPLVNKEQLETTLGYVKIGKEEGANLVFGGEQISEGEYALGHYVTPALFTEVTAEMRIAKEEIFGPVLTIQAVKDVEEAVSVANNVKYGLAASVFTRDLSTAHRLVEEVEAGMVHINHGTASQAHVPFGGVKESGFGAFSIGKTNMDFYTEIKAAYFQY